MSATKHARLFFIFVLLAEKKRLNNGFSSNFLFSKMLLYAYFKRNKGNFLTYCQKEKHSGYFP